MNAPIGFRAAALLLVLLTVLTRVPALLFPHAIDDEAPYAVVAVELVRGGQAYIDAIERKPPLLFWTYAGIFKVAGTYNWAALHAVAIAWVLLTMLGLYVATRRVFDRNTALLAAFFYSVYQLWASWKSLAFNGEVLMLLPLAWAWALAFDRSRSRVRVELIACGALLSAGFLLKQPAAAVAVPVGLYVCDRALREDAGRSPAIALVNSALLTAGFFGMLAVAVAILWRQGIFAEALYWTITNHSLQYVFWTRGALHTLAFTAECLPLLLGAAVALRDRTLWRDRRSERFALIGWLVAAVIGMAAGGRFYPHYYIEIVPPLAILAAAAYAPLLSGAVARVRRLPSRRIAAGWLAATALTFLVVNAVGLARGNPDSAAADYIRAHSAPNARIFVWGQSTEIYTESERRPASRYIATFPLTGFVFGPRTTIDTSNRIVPGAWALLGRDLEKRSPAFVVDAETRADSRYPVSRFPMIAQLLADRYVLVDRASDGDVYERRSDESLGPD